MTTLFGHLAKVAWDAHTYPSFITLQGKKVAFLPQIQKDQLILLVNFLRTPPSASVYYIIISIN
jgi:hypothetical protein